MKYLKQTIYLLLFAFLFGLPNLSMAQLSTCMGSLDMVPVLGNASGIPVNAQPLAVVPVSCLTGSFGTIDANAQGGTNPITYNWNTGSNTQTLTNLNVGTYTVNITDATNCTGSASITLVHQGTVVLNLTGNPLIGCNNPAANLAVQTGFDSYNWSNNAAVVSTTNTHSTTTAGTYTVAVTYLNGCNGSSSTTVVVDYSPPTVNINATTTTLDCAGTSTATLTASGATTYNWLGATQTVNPTTAAINVNTAGTFSVTATGINGCTNTATIDVTSVCDEIYEPADDQCNNIYMSVGTHVQGNTWTILRNANGRAIAAINPNGFDMGLVTVQPHLYATPPFFNGEMYLPRYFDFVVQHQPSATNPVQVRLYFSNADLAAANTAAISASLLVNPSTRDRLSMVHYNDVNTDCDIFNSTGVFDVHSPATVNDAAYGATTFSLDDTFNSFSEYGAKMPVNLLPVELLYFRGKVVGNDNVLDWSTASEKNTAVFILERSNDGSNFMQIGSVRAAGNSSIQRFYQTTDANAPVNAYYRLRILDNDGTYKFSDIIYLERIKGSVSIVNLYPNPTSGTVTVAYETVEANTTVSITLLDAIGQLITTQKITAAKGINTLPMDLSNLPSGVYTVVLDAEGSKRIVRKLVKN